MAINRIDLLNHAFSRTLRGYDPAEVDSFLQEVGDTIARLSDERVRLTNHINQLEGRLSEYADREALLRDSLIAMQRMGENMKAAAQKEGQLIIDSAHAKAEHLTNQATLRLARILDEIADARKLKAQFEFKVRSVIESHLKLLELSQIDDTRMERATAALNDKITPRNNDKQE